ncbi:MAG: subclass B3 metallo-beta-lactamase [Lysobacteraceae bacterium]|nr:MAG: subclass B3 metallo-beta-lactamase [Xanthomonadaceae bacterium]
MPAFPVAVLAAALIAAPPSWTAAQAPYRIHGNAWQVGSAGLSAILVTSDAGHVLIDVPLAANVERVEANVRALGFRVEDIRMILNTHAHFDHAGGIAALARRSGAQVRSSTASARALRSGGDDPDDPQHGSADRYAPVAVASTFGDGEVVRVGTLALTAHLTPGHTPGSTSWSWRSCERSRCLDLVYADSLTAISDDGYLYSDPAHPQRVADFRRGLAMIAKLPCDILVTPHPEASGLDERIERRDAGEADALVDRSACRRYAREAGERLDQRLAREHAAPHP